MAVFKFSLLLLSICDVELGEIYDWRAWPKNSSAKWL